MNPKNKIRTLIRKIIEEGAKSSHTEKRIRERVYNILDIESGAFLNLKNPDEIKNLTKTEITKSIVNKINYALSRTTMEGVVGISLGNIRLKVGDKLYGLNIRTEEGTGNIYYLIVRTGMITTIILYSEKERGKLTQEKLQSLVEEHERKQGRGYNNVAAITKESKSKYSFPEAPNDNVINLDKYVKL